MANVFELRPIFFYIFESFFFLFGFVGFPCMWGSGPHMLGDQVNHIKTKKKKIKKKKKPKRRGKRGKTHLPRFHQQVDPTSNVVRSSWNLEERFETRVATIWMVKIRFWARELVLLPVNNNDIFWYTFSNFLCFFTRRDCIIQGYMCSWCIFKPLYIIIEKTGVTHYCW